MLPVEVDGVEFTVSYTLHPGLPDENGIWIPVFDLLPEISPKHVGRTDDMIKAEAIEPIGHPIEGCFDDMILCLLVKEVEFREIVDAEEAEVLLWPAGKEEPTVVRTGFIFLSLLEIGMMTGTVIGYKISDNVHLVFVNTNDQLFQVIF